MYVGLGEGPSQEVGQPKPREEERVMVWANKKEPHTGTREKG